MVFFLCVFFFFFLKRRGRGGKRGHANITAGEANVCTSLSLSLRRVLKLVHFRESIKFYYKRKFLRKIKSKSSRGTVARRLEELCVRSREIARVWDLARSSNGARCQVLSAAVLMMRWCVVKPWRHRVLLLLLLLFFADFDGGAADFLPEKKVPSR